MKQFLRKSYNEELALERIAQQYTDKVRLAGMPLGVEIATITTDMALLGPERHYSIRTTLKTVFDPDKRTALGIEGSLSLTEMLDRIREYSYSINLKEIDRDRPFREGKHRADWKPSADRAAFSAQTVEAASARESDSEASSASTIYPGSSVSNIGSATALASTAAGTTTISRSARKRSKQQARMLALEKQVEALTRRLEGRDF